MSIIRGNPVGASAPKPDWAQTDPTKADYIKNKPKVLDGEDGLTPYIGDNGNWWIGETDTGVQAQGKQGPKGETGAQGPKGEKGAAGADGFSPVVDVTAIDGGHSISITDKTGTKTFDVMDGTDGENAEGGGTVHWDDVEGKPVAMVGGSDTLTWDGNTEGLTEVLCEFAPDEFKFYKVSDAVFTDDEIRTMALTFFSGENWAYPIDFDESDFTEDSVSSDGYPFVVFIRKAGATAFAAMGGQVFPEAGVYFFMPTGEEFTSSLTVPGYAGFNAQEKIAPSHLYQPDWEQMSESKPDFIKNKPFGEEMETVNEAVNIQWDGSTAGLVEVISKVEDNCRWYKVSDTVFDDDAIRLMNVTFVNDVYQIGNRWTYVYTDENATIAQSPDDPFVVFVRNPCVLGSDLWLLADAEFPAPGVYLFKPEEISWTTQITSGDVAVPQKKRVVKTLEKKYLPMEDITAAVIAALPIYNGEVEEV